MADYAYDQANALLDLGVAVDMLTTAQRPARDDCRYHIRPILGVHEIPAVSGLRHEFVAHFPNEWRRDPQSPYLREAYHDVPWDDPPLLKKLIQDFR